MGSFRSTVSQRAHEGPEPQGARTLLQYAASVAHSGGAGDEVSTQAEERRLGSVTASVRLGEAKGLISISRSLNWGKGGMQVKPLVQLPPLERSDSQHTGQKRQIEPEAGTVRRAPLIVLHWSGKPKAWVHRLHPTYNLEAFRVRVLP